MTTPGIVHTALIVAGEAAAVRVVFQHVTTTTKLAYTAIKSVANQYSSFMIAPSGHRSGTPQSNAQLQALNDIIAFMYVGQAHGLDWMVVRFGGDAKEWRAGGSTPPADPPTLALNPKADYGRATFTPASNATPIEVVVDEAMPENTMMFVKKLTQIMQEGVVGASALDHYTAEDSPEDLALARARVLAQQQMAGERRRRLQHIAEEKRRQERIAVAELKDEIAHSTDEFPEV